MAIKKTLEYELWANKKILDFLKSNPEIQGKAISLFAHILNASNIWLNRIEGKPDQYNPWREIPKEDLENETNLLKTRLENLILTYSGSFGNEIRIYKNTKGDEFKNSIENILLHVTHHGAYHRGQIVQLLKEKHKNAPATDYIVWMRENGVI